MQCIFNEYYYYNVYYNVYYNNRTYTHTRFGRDGCCVPANVGVLKNTFFSLLPTPNLNPGGWTFHRLLFSSVDTLFLGRY